MLYLVLFYFRLFWNHLLPLNMPLKYKLLIPVYLLLVAIAAAVTITPPVSKTPLGALHGRWFTTRNGNEVKGYLGIPYAAPPVGELRFKSPQPPKPWGGILDATKDTPGCIQKVGPPFIPIRPNVSSEDCLYLNVFTPNIALPANLPVVVFIYGGSFETGSGDSSVYGPDYLLDEEVVLVTLTYRGGLLGFLSLEHPVLPGNLGLKDQRAALRFVKQNIQYFGGDPKRITIFGQSSGAISVHFLLISSSNEDLFRAAIADSGSARSYFGFQPPGSQRAIVEQLANLTACPLEPVAMVQCLRQIPAQRFVSLTEELKLKTSHPDIKIHTPLFTPVIEPACVEDAIVTQNPLDAKISTRLLQGSNQLEGLFRAVEIEKDKTDKKFTELNTYYRDILPYNLYIENYSENPEEIAEQLKQFYFGNTTIDRNNYIKLVNLVSDALYNYGLVTSTRSNTEKTFFYQMNYKGSNSLVHYLGSTADYGVSHADELFYLFPYGGPSKRNITERDTTFSKSLVKMWTNFVKYLDPTPQGYPIRWKPVSTDSIEYLDIGQHQNSMKRDFLKSRIDFWDSLHFRNKNIKDSLLCGVCHAFFYDKPHHKMFC